VVWGHCREVPELGVGYKIIKLVCLYCGKAFASGGINQLKQNLAQTKQEME
jgi:hypothetical protein